MESSRGNMRSQASTYKIETTQMMGLLLTCLHVYLHPPPAVAEPLLFSRRPERSTTEHQSWFSITSSISGMSISILDFIINIIRLLRALSVKHRSWICKCPTASGWLQTPAQETDQQENDNRLPRYHTAFISSRLRQLWPLFLLPKPVVAVAAVVALVVPTAINVSKLTKHPTTMTMVYNHRVVWVYPIHPSRQL